MEIKRFELDELFKEIEELLKYVEEEKLLDTNYMLFLANDEKLKYKLTKEAIPHLLGINTSYLVSTGLYSSKNSYYVMEEMLNDSYRIYKAASDGIINYDKLFSRHIKEKLKWFKKNIIINVMDIDVICKYNKDIIYNLGEENEKYDYIITKRYENGEIGLLCLIYNNGVLSPISNQILVTEDEKDEKLSKLLTQQEITYASGINMLNFGLQRSSITFKEKLKRLEQLKLYKQKYNSSIDVHNECNFLLNKLVDVRDHSYQNDDAIDKIAEQIKNGSIIDSNEDPSLNKIVAAFNDFICNTSMDSNEAYISYTEQTKKLEELRKEIAELKIAKKVLEEDNANLNSNNKYLSEANEQLSKTFTKIYKILQNPEAE